jgi:hydroxyethylthiazole kinase
MQIDLEQMLRNVRNRKPVIHNITNYVTVNDVANAELAIGASPIMSDDINEAKDIVAICNGLNINIGTLNERTVDTMQAAGTYANQMKKAVLLDPVGMGASKFRMDVTKHLVNHIDFDVIKGNASEIKALMQGTMSNRGVDVGFDDVVTKDNMKKIAEEMNKLARDKKCIVAMTGEIDLIANGLDAFAVYNGHAEMSQITGTGCLLAGLTTAFIAANTDHMFAATIASICAMGVAGEIGYSHKQPYEGNSSYRNHIIDALYHLSASDLAEKARYEQII